jgi:hypothetical protein
MLIDLDFSGATPNNQQGGKNKPDKPPEARKKETFCAHNLLKFKRLFCKTASHYRGLGQIVSINLIKFG